MSRRDVESIDGLVAGMGHELRTPLNAIIGFTDLLLMELPGPLNDAQRQHLAQIGSAGRTMLGMTDNLVELARLELGEIELQVAPSALGPILDDVRSAYLARAAEKGLSLEVGVTVAGSLRDRLQGAQTDRGAPRRQRARVHGYGRGDDPRPAKPARPAPCGSRWWTAVPASPSMIGRCCSVRSIVRRAMREVSAGGSGSACASAAGSPISSGRRSPSPPRWGGARPPA